MVHSRTYRDGVPLTIGVWLVLLLCGASLGRAQTPAPNPPNHMKSKTIVIMGDSLAAGFGVEPDEAFPALLQKKIADAGWKDTVVNAGVSGDASADGLGRIDWLLRRRVDVFILELGGNDGLRGIPASETRTNLQAILDRVKAKYPRAQLVVAGMLMPVNLGADYREAFRKIFPELAAQNRAALVPFLLEGVAAKTELMQPDRIHPNAAGHRLVAETVWRILEPLLRQTPGPAAPGEPAARGEK